MNEKYKFYRRIYLQLITAYKAIFPLFYGALIAGTYMFLKTMDADGGIQVLGVAALLCFVIHLVLKPKAIYVAIFDKLLIFRGILFALTQVFILKAQEDGLTSIAFIVSVFGSIWGTILAGILLKEKPSRHTVLAAFLSAFGVIINPIMFQATYIAALAGVIQGMSTVTARSLIHKGTGIFTTVGIGYLILFFVMLLSFIFHKSKLPSFFSVNYFHVLLIAVAILVVQYSFFTLFQIYNVQRGSLVSLSRIPWALLLERIILGISPSLMACISGVFIMLSTLLTVMPFYKKKISN